MAEKVFSGGEKLQAKLAELAAQLQKSAEVRIGFLDGATYPSYSRQKLRAAYLKKKKKGDTTAVRGSSGGQPVAMIAAILEFGAPEAHIPPRPFFRSMIAEKSAAWGDQVANLLKLNDFDAERALALMGEGISGQLRDSIIATNAPELKPETVARKGFDKPLIDTGHLLASVSYEVKT